MSVEASINIYIAICYKHFFGHPLGRGSGGYVIVFFCFLCHFLKIMTTTLLKGLNEKLSSGVGDFCTK